MLEMFCSMLLELALLVLAVGRLGCGIYSWGARGCGGVGCSVVVVDGCGAVDTFRVGAGGAAGAAGAGSSGADDAGVDSSATVLCDGVPIYALPHACPYVTTYLVPE